MATDSGLPSPDEERNTAVDLKSLVESYEYRAEARRKETALKSASVTVAVALSGLMASFLAVYIQDGTERTLTRNTRSDYLDKITNQEGRLKAIELSLKKISTLKPNGQNTSQSQVANEISTLDAKVNNLNAAILASPDKALAVPLLRRDIDTLTKRVEEIQAQGKADIDRLYEQQKWTLGGIGTVLLAVAGGAITIILRSLPSSNKNPP